MPGNSPTVALHSRLARKNANRERAARDVLRNPELIDDVLDGLASDRPAVKYGCAKILRFVAERRPELLYPHFAFFVDLLDSENNVIQWEAIHGLSHLARIDSRGRITRVLDRYLQPLRGPTLVTAANVIAGAGRIAAAKPKLADKVATALRRVANAHYRTPACREVALGAVILAFDEFLPHVSRRQPVIRFVRELRDSPRPTTRRKAEAFLAKWSATE